MSTHSFVAKYEIVDDNHGSKIVVSEDVDGLGMVELRNIEHDGEVSQTLLITLEQLPLVMPAIGNVAHDLAVQKKSE